MKIVYLAKVWHYGENKSNDKHRNLIKSLQFVVSLNSNLPNRPPLHPLIDTIHYGIDVSSSSSCMFVIVSVCLSVCPDHTQSAESHYVDDIDLCGMYYKRAA